MREATPQRLTPEDLTPREREVLRHVVDLASYGEIARRLNISCRTAEVHVRNIAGKVGGRDPAYRRVLRWAHTHAAAPGVES